MTTRYKKEVYKKMKFEDNFVKDCEKENKRTILFIEENKRRVMEAYEELQNGL